MRTSTEIAAAYLGGDAAKSDLVAEIDALVAAEREACAKIAEAHRGSALANRRDKGFLYRTMSLRSAAEIEAEERGEDIAAGMIARAIRARTET